MPDKSAFLIIRPVLIALFVLLIFYVSLESCASSMNLAIEFYPRVPFSHEYYEGGSSSFTDFFGDKYYFFMEPLQEATYASEIVIYANTDADRFLSIGAGLGFPDDNKSYYFFDFGGGINLFMKDKVKISTGIYFEALTYEYAYDSYRPAWAGDPGYYTGENFIRPGTPVYARIDGTGGKITLDGKYSISEKSNILVKIYYRNINFDDVLYVERGEDVDLNFDASGLTVGLGYNYEFGTPSNRVHKKRVDSMNNRNSILYCTFGGRSKSEKIDNAFYDVSIGLTNKDEKLMGLGIYSTGDYSGIDIKYLDNDIESGLYFNYGSKIYNNIYAYGLAGLYSRKQHGKESGILYGAGLIYIPDHWISLNINYKNRTGLVFSAGIAL